MTTTASRSPSPQRPPARRFAVIGAGMAGVACARTLMQAGHSVSVFERQERPGGRMATQETPFGSFDAGAQFFTVRDARFERALQTVNGLCRPWSATSLRVLDDPLRADSGASTLARFVVEDGRAGPVRM